MMNALLWICRGFVLIFLLAFAASNMEVVSIRLPLGSVSWQVSLIIVILCSFAVGALLGVLALLGTVFNLRKEVSRLSANEKTKEAKTDCG